MPRHHDTPTKQQDNRSIANNSSSGGISLPAPSPFQFSNNMANAVVASTEGVIQRKIGDGEFLLHGRIVKHKPTGITYEIIGSMRSFGKIFYRLSNNDGNTIELAAEDDPAYDLVSLDSSSEEDSYDEGGNGDIQIPDDLEPTGNDSGEGTDEESMSEDGDIYDQYPKIMDVVSRPGHINPYRHGIGAADTIAVLAIDRKRLIAKVGGDDVELIQEIEDEFNRLDALIKKINDELERPILRKMAAVKKQRDALLDIAEPTKEQTKQVEVLEATLGDLEMELHAIKEAEKKAYREELRALYERIFWISQDNIDDRNKERRRKQIAELRRLAKEKGFEYSYQSVVDDPTELFDHETDPELTAHHSEQRMIVSKEWIKIRKTILEDVQAAMHEGGTVEEIIARISEIVISMILNRSSCNVCNAFLVAELITLWKDIAVLLDCSWTEAKEMLKNIIHFEISYSVPYAKADDVDALDEQLELAGWHIQSVDRAEASDDEREHEILSMGREVSSETKQKKRGGSGARKRKIVDEYIDQPNKRHKKNNDGPGEDAPLEKRERRQRTNINTRLKAFLLKSFKVFEEGEVMQVLSELGFTHHPQPGNGLNCALYSMAHQLSIQHGIHITDMNAFTSFVRKKAGLAFNTMIDVLNSGPAVLNAIIDYLVKANLLADGQGLSLTVWANDNQEGLMEFKNVARSGGGGRVLVLYYNGFSHFDSLSGGI